MDRLTYIGRTYVSFKSDLQLHGFSKNLPDHKREVELVALTPLILFVDGEHHHRQGVSFLEMKVVVFTVFRDQE